MIRYTLKCDNDHSFDSWFRSADAYEKLRATDMVCCAVCGSLRVKKAVMAPPVRPARSAKRPADATAAAGQPASPPAGPLSQPASQAETALAELRAKVEASSEDVGRDFAREARAIHYGDAPSRPIIGEAKPAEAKSLIEDGIPVAPLPWGGQKTN